MHVYEKPVGISGFTGFCRPPGIADTTTRSPAVLRDLAERIITDNAPDFPGLPPAINASLFGSDAVHSRLEGTGSAAHDVGMIGASAEGE